MLQVLKDYAWLTGILALLVVIIDKYKYYFDKWRVDRLKRDKALLFPILDLEVDKYHEIEKYGKGGLNIKPNYPKLKNAFLQIDTTRLINKGLAKDIEAVQQLEPDDMFMLSRVEHGVDRVVLFAPAVNAVLVKTRYYLSEII